MYPVFSAHLTLWIGATSLKTLFLVTVPLSWHNKEASKKQKQNYGLKLKYGFRQIKVVVLYIFDFIKQ